MATITRNIKPVAGGAKRVIWETMGDDDTGTDIELPQHPDKTVTMKGTWASATVVLQGSNDGTNYDTLKDSTGTAISATADLEPKLILTNPQFIRAVSSGGSGTDVDVVLTAI
jgi:hypothetical protein